MRYKIQSGAGYDHRITFMFDENEYHQVKSITFKSNGYGPWNKEIFDAIGSSVVVMTSDNNAKKLLAYTKLKRLGHKAGGQELARVAQECTLYPRLSQVYGDPRYINSQTEMITKFDFLNIQNFVDNLVRGAAFLQDFNDITTPNGWVQ